MDIEKLDSHPFAFGKSERLHTKADFDRLFREGKRYHSRHFMVVYRKNGLSYSRLGLTVSRRVGHAVARNRIKRLLRNFFRTHKSLFSTPLDINFVAKNGAAQLSYQDLVKEVETTRQAVST